MEESLKQTHTSCHRIVLFGPESTGKTSIAKQLAAHYNTRWVPEFAREYLQKKYDDVGIICEETDLIPIAKGQMELENTMAEKANKLLFCDTNMLQTYYYGKAYYENYKGETLKNAALKASYALYFLTYIDVPWEADDLRDKPHQREEMFNLFKQALEENNLPYVLLKGTAEERLQIAINAIEKNLKTLK